MSSDHNLPIAMIVSCLIIALGLIAYLKRFEIACLFQRIHGFTIVRPLGTDVSRVAQRLYTHARARAARVEHTLHAMLNAHRFDRLGEAWRRATKNLQRENAALQALLNRCKGIRIGSLPKWAYRVLLIGLFLVDGYVSFLALQVLHLSDAACVTLALLSAALLAVLADKAGHAFKNVSEVIDGWILVGIGAVPLATLIALRALYLLTDPKEHHPFIAAALFGALCASLFTTAVALALNNDLAWPLKVATRRSDMTVHRYERHVVWYRRRAETYIAQRRELDAAFRLGACHGWLGDEPLSFPDFTITMPAVPVGPSPVMLIPPSNLHAPSPEVS